jgi:hypothetical protein
VELMIVFVVLISSFLMDAFLFADARWCAFDCHSMNK